jgi:aspartate dehydrogenase
MQTVGLVGFGAIGRYIARHWSFLAANYRLTHVMGRAAQLDDIRAACGPDVVATDDPQQFFADLPDMVIEAAGHDAVRRHGAHVLDAGRELCLLSIGALADEVTAERLRAACAHGGGRILVPAGALAGFDGLKALCSSGLQRVS